MNVIWNTAEEPDLFYPARVHPWTDATYSDESKYYDFRKNPELIPEVLEDFRPWSEYPAIQTFYDFLRWVNSDKSVLETNDSAFRFYQDKSPMVASGRVMIFFHKEELNLIYGISHALTRTFIEQLTEIDRHFIPGLFKVSRYPIAFVNCFNKFQIDPLLYSPIIESHATNLEFEAYGETPFETMENLNRLFEGMLRATRITNALFKIGTNLELNISVSEQT
jgi:hypothetical protein